MRRYLPKRKAISLPSVLWCFSRNIACTWNHLSKSHCGSSAISSKLGEMLLVHLTGISPIPLRLCRRRLNSANHVRYIQPLSKNTISRVHVFPQRFQEKPPVDGQNPALHYLGWSKIWVYKSKNLCTLKCARVKKNSHCLYCFSYGRDGHQLYSRGCIPIVRIPCYQWNLYYSSWSFLVLSPHLHGVWLHLHRLHIAQLHRRFHGKWRPNSRGCDSWMKEESTRLKKRR